MKAGVDFLHIVMTRFNLPTPGREHKLRSRPGWLERRFELFERHCLPTLAAQEAESFHWVIYFDEATPEPFRERIEAARRIFPFIPYYTGPFEAEGWPRSLRALFPDRPEWLLTTRIDNDDGLSRDHVARLHAALAEAPPERGALNFTNGFVLREGRVYAHVHPCNAFFSWLDRDETDLRTALSIRHMDLAEAGPVRQLGGPGAWLQVVHDINVSNKIRGRRVGPEAVRDRFPDIALGALEAPSPAAVAFENAVLAPIRAGRDAALALRRRFV